MSTTVERTTATAESEVSLEVVDARSALLDPITGQPYLVLPIDIPAKHPDGEMVTYHHVRYYRRDEHLGRGASPAKPDKTDLHVIAGLSVRLAGGQYMKRSLHEIVHDRFPRGPRLPVDRAQKFQTAVTTVVGIVPREVIDVSKPEGHEIVHVTSDDFEKVADCQYVGLEHFRSASTAAWAQRTMGYFFLRHASKQDLEQIDPSQLDQFVHTRNREQKVMLATAILGGCLEMAVDPFRTKLDELRRKGYAQPGRSDVLSELRAIIPASSFELVMPKLETEIHDTFRKMQRRAVGH